MNTDISEIESETSAAPIETVKPRRRGAGLAFLALVFALAALAGTAWMWWQGAQSQDESGEISAEIGRLQSSDSGLAQKLQAMQSEIAALPATDSSAEMNGLKNRLESSVAETSRLQQLVNEQLALSRSLQAANEAMQARVAAAESVLAGVASNRFDGGGELDLSEVDYLLRLAGERLQLFFDVAAADQALEMADLQLAAMDNPAYLIVRQDIASVRRELAALSMPDYLEISNQLDGLQGSIATLPLRGDEPQSAVSQQAVEPGWWARFKGVFAGLVTVRRSTDQENEQISLTDKDYIRQGLWLQLEVAQLSLMRRDQAAFRSSLTRVQKTLATWFDVSSARYQSLNSDLAALIALVVQPVMPDISAPWTTLRRIRAVQVRPAQPDTAPAVAVPAAATAVGIEPEAEAQPGQPDIAPASAAPVNVEPETGAQPEPADTTPAVAVPAAATPAKVEPEVEEGQG